MNLEDLKKKAQAIIDLWKGMDEAFGNTRSQDHLLLAIMAGLADAGAEGARAEAEEWREKG